MSAAPDSLPADSLQAARARLDQVRWTCRSAFGQLLSGRVPDALEQLRSALAELDGRGVNFGADEAALDILLAGCVVAAELSRAPRHAALLPDAERLRDIALRRRIAALRGGA